MTNTDHPAPRTPAPVKAVFWRPPDQEARDRLVEYAQRTHRNLQSAVTSLILDALDVADQEHQAAQARRESAS